MTEDVIFDFLQRHFILNFKKRRPLMKRLITLTLMLASAFLFLTGCASRYSINKEAPVSFTQQPYKTIHVGWLDLNMDDWENMGYESKGAWGKVIAANYYEGLKPYMTDLFTDKKLTFSQSMNDTATYGSDLVITFTNTKVDKVWNAMTGGFDRINTTVHFIDAKTIIEQLLDEGIEDEIYDKLSFQDFMNIDMGQPIPDSTTLCRFREWMNGNGIQEKLFRKTPARERKDWQVYITKTQNSCA